MGISLGKLLPFPSLYLAVKLILKRRVLINCPFTPFMVLFCHAIATANLADLKCLGDFVSSLQSPGEAVEAAEKLWRLCQVFHRVAELYIKTKINHQEIYQQQQQQQQHAHLDPGHQSQDAFQQQQQQQQPSIKQSSDETLSDFNTPKFAPLQQQQQQPPALATDDFEPYLSALGFPNAAGFLNLGDHNMATETAAEDYSNNNAPNGASDNIGSWLGGDSFSLENWFTGNVNIMSLVETDLSNFGGTG